MTAREECACYAFDAACTADLPDAVAFPHNTGEVAAVMAIAAEHRIAVVPRGAGTGLTGGSVPLAGGLVMVMTGFNRILSIDPQNFLVVVEPGVTTAALDAAAARHGLFYPPDPASLSVSSIGGNIAENAGGMRAVKYGVTRDFVMGLELVLPNGDIVHTGSKCIKDVVGYDLTRLFIGSEGTLGIICQAILRLVPRPESKQLLTAVFDAPAGAAASVPAIVQAGIMPSAIEFMDHHCIAAVEAYAPIGLPSGAATLLIIEVDGRKDAITADLEIIRGVCQANGALDIRLARDQAGQENLWRSRRAVHAALGQLRTRWEEEDIAVPISRLPDMIAALEKIGARHRVLVASFGHAGDGNIHVSIAGEDCGTPAGAVAAARREILEATVAMEGRIAAEHGIGLIKREKIGWNLDAPTLGLMQGIKRLIDPQGILNPGKIFPCEKRG